MGKGDVDMTGAPIGGIRTCKAARDRSVHDRVPSFACSGAGLGWFGVGMELELKEFPTDQLTALTPEGHPQPDSWVVGFVGGEPRPVALESGEGRGKSGK